MVNQKLILFAVAFVSLLSMASAFSFSGSSLPTTVNMTCENSFDLGDFTITKTNGENLYLEGGVTVVDGIQMHPTLLGCPDSATSCTLKVSFTPLQNCVEKSNRLPHKIILNNGTSNQYDISVKTTQGLHNLQTPPPTLARGNAFKIGSSPNFVFFELKTVASGAVTATIKGCSPNDRDYNIIEGESLSLTCFSQQFRFKLNQAFPSLDNANFEIFSSQPYAVQTVAGETATSDECVLGLDTLGAKVKRGNIFAIKTINKNNNKAVDKVSVTIIDQEGELSPINGESSNTGFFSMRLHADYQQDLIVQLERTDCEPSTQVILFDQSYNDYIAEQEKEQGGKTLVMDIPAELNTGERSGTVKNLLGEGVADAKVKITKPDKTTLEVVTDEDGVFNFSSDSTGVYKFQATKDSFESSELIEVEIMPSNYAIVILVAGKETAEFKKGDLLTFEIRDPDNKIIPLTFEATITSVELDDEEISFLDGVSEEYLFRGEATLEVPAVGGYDENRKVIRAAIATTPSWIYWTFGGLGILGLVIIIMTIRRSNKKKRQVRPLQFQMGEEASR